MSSRGRVKEEGGEEGIRCSRRTMGEEGGGKG